MEATTKDWTLAEQRSARWRIAEQRAAVGDMNCQCLLDLRRRVEALEQRATTEESSAHECAADRPLWREVRGAMQAVPGEFDWVAAQLAAADWLAARGCHGAAHDLRIEARRAREGA